MGFARLRFFQFRNLEVEGLEIDPGTKNVYLIGENGQGKTNFLEAIYLLCFGSSFRTKQEKLFPAIGLDEFSLKGEYRNSGRSLELFLKFRDGKKDVLVDGFSVKDRRELIKNVPCIAFVHDDFLFVQGPPERQRHFFDQTLSLYDPVYMNTLLQYKKILKSRNALLKTNDFLGLEVFEEQMVSVGSVLAKRRREAIDEFNEEFSELFREVSTLPGTLKIRYAPSWKSEDPEALKILLKEKRLLDKTMGATTTGPHRDRYKFFIDEKNFPETASTGQIRLVSLLLRISQARFYSRKTGRLPLLLLDDVLLELDGARRSRLLSALPEYDQAFFTFLPDEPGLIGGQEHSQSFTVRSGRLSPYE